MAVNQQSLSSRVAATSVQRPKPGAGPIKWAWMAGGIALAFALPVIGSIIGYVPNRIANKMDANAEHDSLATHFSGQIGKRLGKDPAKVTRADLYEVAAKDAGFAKLLQSSQQQKESADRSALVGAGAGAILHGSGAVKAIVGSIAADIGASAIFGKDDLFVSDVGDHIDAKRAAGEPVTAEDVFMMRLAQNDTLVQAVFEKTGKKFHKLDDAKRAEIMQAMPALYEASQNDATLLNSGQLSSQELAVQTPQQQGGWTQRVGGKQSKASSFRDQVEARRSQPSAPQLGA